MGDWLVRSEGQSGEDPTAQLRGSDAIARIAEAEVNPSAGQGPEARQVVGPDVDGASPHVREADICKLRKDAAKAGRRPPA